MQQVSMAKEENGGCVTNAIAIKNSWKAYFDKFMSAAINQHTESLLHMM